MKKNTRCHNRESAGGKSRLALALMLALTLTACALGVALPAAGCGPQPAAAAVPDTASEMKAELSSAEAYLTPDGKELAEGKTEGATAYSVTASLDTAKKSLRADERVLYTNRTQDTLTEVVLRVYANGSDTNTTDKPVKISAAEVDGKPAEFSLAGSFLRMTVPGGLAPKDEAFLTFTFVEPIPAADDTETGGIYGYDAGTYDLGNFLPTVVTYSNGAWDTRESPGYGDINYYDCSYYFVSFKAPEEYTVAATGVETAGADGARVFEAGPARDFAVQASTRYAPASRKVGLTTVTSYFDEGRSKTGRMALDSGCEALELFSENFGPYPYTRLNICEAPLEDSLGMEYTGQVQIASFLYEDPDDATYLDLTVAHEVGHQWWALGVGSDAIGHPWQDESLTSYIEVPYSLWRYGEDEALAAEEDLAGGYVGAREEGVPDAVVDQPVASFADVDQYVAMVYSKGAMYFSELWDDLLESGFDEALSNYYKKYVFLNPTPEQQAAEFRAVSDDPAAFDALYNRWIKEVHGDEDIRYEAL